MNERREGKVWAVDADVTLQSLLDDPECPGLLSRVLTRITSWQTRNQTTLARTLRASRPMSEWVAALVTLGAFVTVDGDGGTEEMDVAALIRQRVQGHVRAVHVPRQSDTRWGEGCVARTPSDDPIVAAFAAMTVDGGVVKEARLTLTGVSSQPVWVSRAPRALVGEALNAVRIRDLVSAVEDEVEPEGDYLGSQEYRRAMAGILTRRVLEACAAGLTAGGRQ